MSLQGFSDHDIWRKHRGIEVLTDTIAHSAGLILHLFTLIDDCALAFSDPDMVNTVKPSQQALDRALPLQ